MRLRPTYIADMKTLTMILMATSLSVLPALAQDGDEADSDQMSEGLQLLQDGTRMLLEGLMQEIGPALKDLEGKIDDLNAYYPPEVLPNGDIIIRRKVPLAVPAPEGEVDL
jgi:hypothetical protein